MSIFFGSTGDNVLNKKRFQLLGIGSVVSGIIAIPLLIFLSILLKEPFEKYDYMKIVSNGVPANAKISNILIKGNITINGVNPRIITYEFHDKATNSTFSDRFQTLDVKNLSLIEKQDSIQIFSLNNQSVIKNLAPYRFSIGLLWGVPLLLVAIGSCFVLFGKWFRE